MVKTVLALAVLATVVIPACLILRSICGSVNDHQKVEPRK